MTTWHLQDRLAPLRHLEPGDLDRIRNARIGIVGCGATGTHHLDSLVRMGVENFIIADGDSVEETNLGRQRLFNTEDIGRNKAIAARDAIKRTNPAVRVRAYGMDISQHNIDIFEGADIILDGTDNLITRFIINDFSVKNSIPWIYTGASGTGFMVFPYIPGRACLRCFMSPSYRGDTCVIEGIMPQAVEMASAIATSLAIKIILGRDVQSIMYYGDIWSPGISTIRVEKKDDCPVCSLGNFEFLEKPELVIRRVCRDGFIATIPGDVDVEELVKNAGASVEKGPEGYRLKKNETVITITNGRIKVRGASTEDEARRALREILGI